MNPTKIKAITNVRLDWKTEEIIGALRKDLGGTGHSKSREEF